MPQYIIAIESDNRLMGFVGSGRNSFDTELDPFRARKWSTAADAAGYFDEARHRYPGWKGHLLVFDPISGIDPPPRDTTPIGIAGWDGDGDDAQARFGLYDNARRLFSSYYARNGAPRDE